MKKTTVAFALALIAAAASSACNGADIRYQVVKAACVGALPRGPLSFSQDFNTTASLLTPECKEAVEAAVGPKILEDSFATAPAGYRDRFLESVAAAAMVPMRLPEDLSVFGSAPGAMPLPAVCILEGQKHGGACLGGQTTCPLGGDDPDLVNCNFFHYLLDTVSRYRYGGRNDTLYGLNIIDPDLGTTISVYDSWWPGTGVATSLIMPVMRASILGHEAMHTRNRFHVDCRGINCDPDLAGPYGFEVIILEAFMRGGWGEPSLDPLFPAVSTQDLFEVMRFGCWRIQARFEYLPPEMRALYEGIDCSAISPEMWAERMGLPWPNPAESSPTWTLTVGAPPVSSCGD